MNADSLLMLSRNIQADLKAITELRIKFGEAVANDQHEDQQAIARQLIGLWRAVHKYSVYLTKDAADMSAHAYFQGEDCVDEAHRLEQKLAG